MSIIGGTSEQSAGGAGRQDVLRPAPGKVGLLLEELVNPKVPIDHPILGKIMYEPNWDIERFRTLSQQPITKEMLEVISKIKA